MSELIHADLETFELIIGGYMRIALVGCAKGKVPEAVAARDLYSSPGFADRRTIADAEFDDWFILSGEHGLVEQDRIIEPYENDLNAASVPERRVWANRVLRQVEEALGDDLSSHTFEILAGSAYADFGLKAGLERMGATVEWPVRGLTQGQQAAYYAQRASGGSKTISDRTNVSPSYRPLYEYLIRMEADQATLSFEELEALIGRTLPPSARKYRAWWSGSVARSAWMAAGWNLGRVDGNIERVRFYRGGEINIERPEQKKPGVELVEVDGSLVEQAVAYLTDIRNAEAAATFPEDPGRVASPGLYSWFCDDVGRDALTRSLGLPLPPLIYAGQAGAGKQDPTLHSRIMGMHLWKKIEFSTFRLTLTSLLCNALGLQVIGPRLLAVDAEAKLTSWMKEHLSVATFPLSDRSAIRAIETSVLTELDPPLNLARMSPTPLRLRLKRLRAEVEGGCPSAVGSR